ncbi:MAG: hypothetical protein PVF68_01900 [Acidobacteriota bacterium]
MAETAEPPRPEGPADESYFQAIEEHFARLRGRPLFLSTRDVALVDRWWSQRIPLRIVMEALDGVFARREETGRPVLSLGYCRHAVEAAFHAWSEAQLGAHAGSEPTDPEGGREEAVALLLDDAGALERGEGEARGAAARALRRLAGSLEGSSGMPLDRAEAELARIEDRLIAGLLESMPPPEREALEREVDEALGPLRPRLTEHAFRTTREGRIRAAVREREDLPRLTLYLL